MSLIKRNQLIIKHLAAFASVCIAGGLAVYSLDAWMAFLWAAVIITLTTNHTPQDERDK